jgi:parallel beta-helix repeat protein
MKNFSPPISASKFIILSAIVLGGLWGFGSGDVWGQKIIYVDSAAAPGGNGLSWATAFHTLDPALDTAVYDPGDQVWVAEGTYFPDSLYSGIGLNPRNKTFVMRSGLKIFGGFDSGATSLAQRDFVNNRTILSGDIGVKNDTTDNAFSVVYAWFTDTTAWLDGFIITKGRATDGVSTGFVNGGGIYCPDQVLATGATVRNCTITDNVASSNGGGVFIWQNNVSFYNCTFSQNKANEGGGVFSGNQASGEFKNCVFSENIAGSFGGGAAVRGATNTFINDTFVLNNASNGGAIYVDGGGSPYIANLTIQGNTATNNGGGYYIASLAQVTINNNVITGNYADNQGGGGYAQDAGTNVYVINSTVSGNHADDEGGGFYQTGVLFFIRNSIVYGNTHTASANTYANQLSGNIFFPNHSLIQGIATPSGSSNLNTDPLFLSPIPSSLAPALGGDYRVSKYSPVINEGNNSNLTLDSRDLDGDQNTLELLPLDVQNGLRVENDTADIGAYETLDICRPLGNSNLLFSDDSLQFCEGDSILISTRTGFINYIWSFNGQPVVPPGNTLAVDTTGKVIIRLSDTTGCATTDSLETLVQPLPQPQIVASATPLCLGDSAYLATSVSYSDYLWSTGSSSDTLTIGVGGKYWVDIADANGCSSSDTITVSDVPKPILTLSPADSLSLCDGDSVLLRASGNFLGFAWSTGALTDSIWVDKGGLYIVTATDGNGCVVVDTIEVTLLPTPTANILANGPLEFCDGDSVVLDAGNHAQYAWSTGASSRMVTINQSDSVFVTVTNVEGCSDRDSVVVKVNSLPNSTIFFANDTIFCQGDSILLSVNNNYSSYAWSNGDTTFATIVKTTGLVTVLVTDSNNCSSTGQINTIASPLPQPQIQAAGPSTSFCQGGSVLLGLGFGDFATVLWENDSTGPRTNATVGGYFSVDVTDSLGCAGSDSILITVFPNPTPAITPGGIVELCQGDTAFLDAGVYVDYTWFHSGFAISNLQVLATDSAGNYSVSVTDTNNCVGTDLVRVDVNPKPVIAFIDTSGPTTFCDGDSVVLDAGVFGRYQWSTGETTRTITVNTSGTYKVIVFNSFDCSDSASITVTVNPNPVATINPLGSTTICFGDSLRLDGGFHSQYQWSTGDTTSFIWVKTGNQFILEVTNNFGCTDSDTISTVLGPVLNPTISLSGSSTLCDGDSLVLFAGVFPAYRWSTGETTQIITVKNGGQYWVEVSVPIGCSGSDTVDINLVNNPTVSILPLGPTTFCDEDSVVLDADAFEEYNWSTGDTTRFLTVDTSGLFFVTVTDANNCQAIDSINTTVLPSQPRKFRQ